MLRFCHQTGFGVNPVWLKWNCLTVCQLLNCFIYLLSTCLLLFSANVIQRLHEVDASRNRNPELRTNGCYRPCFRGWSDLSKCQLAVLASAKDRKVSTLRSKTFQDATLCVYVAAVSARENVVMFDVDRGDVQQTAIMQNRRDAAS